MDSNHTAGFSRRTVLRLSAAGFAAALGTEKLETTYAQDETPAAAGELPEGVGFMSLSAVPIRDLPTEPFTIQVSRYTLEPGAVVPNSELPYPSAAYVEKGTGLICPPGGEGRWITDAEGKPVNSGAMEMAFPEGTWCYTAPDTMDGVRNDGTDQAVGLIVELIPTTA